MNETQARDNGYTSTGLYSRNKEEIKLAAKTLRDKGNKAIVVSIPPNKLSRRIRSTGYQVFWIESEENKQIREAAERQKRIDNLRTRRSSLLAEVFEVDKEIRRILIGD